jgi:hypothetical protein
MTTNNTPPRDLLDLFVDVMPRKRRAPRARFEIRVEWRDGTNMEGEGTRRDLLAEFADYVGDPEVAAVEITRNGVEIREWRAGETAGRHER